MGACGRTGVNFMVGLKNCVRVCSVTLYVLSRFFFYCFLMAQEKSNPRPLQRCLSLSWTPQRCTSLKPPKERVRDWRRNGEKGRKKRAHSYISSHHLPGAKLARRAVNMSSGQAAAKTLETTYRLRLTLDTNTHTYWTRKHTRVQGRVK